MGVSRRGKVWYARWKDASGIWRRTATSAKSKKDAQDLFAELVYIADRQRRGLDARPMRLGMNLWGLCRWWLEHRCPKASKSRAGSTLKTQLAKSALGELALARVTAGAIDAHLDKMEAEGYAPRSLNHFRTLLRVVLNKTKRASLWAGENPAALVAHREDNKAPRPTLTQEEVLLVLKNVPPQWAGFFAVAAFLGLRKGEICGLLKVDYDRVRRTLYVGRSYEAVTTKGKRIDYLPVSDSLASYLSAALETPGPHLFPGPKGAMRSPYSVPHDILRVALKRAGLITGWAHKCRWCARKGTRKPVLSATDETLWCEHCKFKLWPVAIPREMRFHDLRHSAATHLLQAGVPIQHVQRILRHASITTTVNLYGHLLTEDLRGALEILGPQPAQLAGLRRVK